MNKLDEILSRIKGVVTESEYQIIYQEIEAEFKKQKEEMENEAKKGYNQACEIIDDIRNRIILLKKEQEKQIKEYEKHLEMYEIEVQGLNSALHNHYDEQ